MGRETEPGKITHTDLWGKYDIASINGNRYYLLLVDNAMQYVTVHFLKQKSQATQKVIEYIAHLKAWKKSPCGIQMDHSTEFINVSLHNMCDVQGIDLQMTAPYLPSQNGITEHMNRMLEELACAMLTGAKLPKFLWELAIAHATYLRNLSYTTMLPTVTPYQAWHGKKLNVSHLREFGAPVWILLQGQNIQHKMLPKSQCQAYVGVDEGAKAIRYYNAATRNILTLRNYHFLEPSKSSPPEDIVVDMRDDQGEYAPPHEGENDHNTRKSDNEAIIPKK